MKNYAQEYLDSSYIGMFRRGDVCIDNREASLTQLREVMNFLLPQSYAPLGWAEGYIVDVHNPNDWRELGNIQKIVSVTVAELKTDIDCYSAILGKELISKLSRREIALEYDMNVDSLSDLIKVFQSANLSTVGMMGITKYYLRDYNKPEYDVSAIKPEDIPVLPIKYLLAEINETEENLEPVTGCSSHSISEPLIKGHPYYVSNHSEEGAKAGAKKRLFVAQFGGVNYFTVDNQILDGKSPLISAQSWRYAVKAANEEKRFTSEDFVNALNSIEIDKETGETKISGAFCAGYWIPFLDITPS